MSIFTQSLSHPSLTECPTFQVVPTQKSVPKEVGEIFLPLPSIVQIGSQEPQPPNFFTQTSTRLSHLNMQIL
jgi:hypothetical protein